jgi:hypothetical protein
MIGSSLLNASFLASPAVLSVWRPFIDPIDAHRTWFMLLIPMAFFISMVYKAVRLPDLASYWRQVIVMTVQIILGIIALGAVIFVFIQYIAPLIIPIRD